MNKTLLLLALPSLLGACVEPNRLRLGGDHDDESSGSGDMSAEDTGDDAPEGTGGETGSDPADDSSDQPPDDGEDSGESGDGESGEPEEPVCDLATHECVSNVPKNWHGPVARIAADHPTGCHGEYATPGAETYSGVFAAPAECTCECSDPGGGSCDGSVQIDLFAVAPFFGAILNEDDCDNATDGMVLSSTLVPYPDADVNMYDVRVRVETPSVAQAGACSAASGMAALAEPILDDQMQACEPRAPIVGCDEDTMCVPRADAPYEGGVCIWQEGEQPCPGGTDFVNRYVVDTGVVDTRTCSTCGCGEAQGEACVDGNVYLYRGAAPWVEVPTGSDCFFASIGGSPQWTGLNYDANGPSGGACEVIGGEAEGEVTPAGQITYCCA